MLGHSCSSFLGAPAFARRVCLQNFARSTIVPSRLSSVPRPGRHIGNLQQTLCQRQHVMGSTQEERSEAKEVLQKLLDGSVRCVEFTNNRMLVDQPRSQMAYLPGSFNPLHDGHRDMLAAALEQLQWGSERGCYELSVGNPDKGVLPLQEVLKRIHQFTAANLPIVVTHATLYTQKADVFHDSAFVVGHDTAIRLVAPRYYNDDEEEMIRQLADMHSRGCQVLVAGRVDKDGTFRTLKDIPIPPTLEKLGLFQAISEEVFRSDISSTQLRDQTSKR